MEFGIRRADERGETNIGWLKSRHSFSFGDYYNQENIHFGALRVINDDIIDANAGFGTHPHNNMEIITIILEGSLTHKDSMGNLHTIQPNEVQVMSAGTGITHSEYNSSPDEAVKLLQIWIIPKERNIQPAYDQKEFNYELNKTTVVASGFKLQDELYIHQDAALSITVLEAGKTTAYNLIKDDSLIYVLVISGEIKIGENKLAEKDSAEIENEKTITISAESPSKVLIIEVPPIR